MIDVCVGERPKGVSRGTLEEFNGVFLKMFEHFQSHKRIVTVFHDSHKEDPLTVFGSLTVSQVRKWLKYHQLVTVKKERETYEVKRKPCFGKFKQDTSCSLLSKYSSWCADEEDCIKASSNPEEFENTKTRNINIIRPTKRGFLAYENGLVIQVDWGSPVQVGLGKPYPERARKLHDLAGLIWKKAKISQSRQAKWWSDLHQFCIGLLGLKTDEASRRLHSWASAKAWEWNVNHRRRLGIKSACYSLPETQRRLFE